MFTQMPKKNYFVWDDIWRANWIFPHSFFVNDVMVDNLKTKSVNNLAFLLSNYRMNTTILKRKICYENDDDVVDDEWRSSEYKTILLHN